MPCQFMACRLGTQGPGHTDAASQVEVAILVLLVPRDKQRKGGVRRKGRFRAVSAMQMRSEHIEAVQAVHLLGHPSLAARLAVQELVQV